MKTKILLASTALAAIFLSGCGGDNLQSATSARSGETSANAPAAPEVTTSVPAEKIETLSPSVIAAAKGTNAACSLDTVDGNYSKDQVRLNDKKSHEFRGWILNTEKLPAGKFGVVLQGRENFVVPASTGVLRADVGSFFKDPRLDLAGFNISTTLGSIPKGEYKVTLMINREEHAFICETGKKITLI